MLTKEQIAQAKGRGFLLNRGTEQFSGRVVCPGAVYTAGQVKAIAACAEQFGSGKVVFTVRMGAEIPGIPYDRLDAAEAFLAGHGLGFGGTGSKIRPVVACKGTTCVYGNCDTQGLARTLYEEYYLGQRGRTLPHKFKIGVGGCPNGCVKPMLNDFGIQGHRTPRLNEEACRRCKACSIVPACRDGAIRTDAEGRPAFDRARCISCGVCIRRCPFGAVQTDRQPMYRIAVGGMAGRHLRAGTPLSRLVRQDEIGRILDRTLDWYCEHANGRERLGAVIDRVGMAGLDALLTEE